MKAQQESSSIHQENMDERTSDDQSNTKNLAQRKQEMVDLYASLVAHVPLEYQKGEKSISSDHIQEAVDYITDMKNNIKKLRGRREELKAYLSSSGNSMTDAQRGSSSSSSRNLVMVEPCRPDGVEILINSSFKEEGFPLSKILKELLGRGFDVVSCVSTAASQRSLHNVLCQVKDLNCNDLAMLQKRLDSIINLDQSTDF